MPKRVTIYRRTKRGMKKIKTVPCPAEDLGPRVRRNITIRKDETIIRRPRVGT